MVTRPCSRPFSTVLVIVMLLASLNLARAETAQESNGTPGTPSYVGRHKVQVYDATVASRLAAQGGRQLADYGGYQLFDLPEVSPALLEQPEAEMRDDYNIIALKAARLDTSTATTQALRKPVGDFSGKRMHLVQFAGPVQPAWREQLEQAGVQVVAYVPQNAYLVYGDAQSLARLQNLASTAPHVQWEGPYSDDYKIHPAARLRDADGNPRMLGTDQFAIQLVADSTANDATLQLLNQLRLEPFQRRNVFKQYLNIVVRLNPESLALVAAQPDVVSIQPYFPRRKLCERQDQILAGNLIGTVPSGPGYLAWLASKGFKQSQFTASALVVDVSDSGLDNGTTSPNHPALYVQGDTNNASRVAYVRLEGNPAPGSPLNGCDGHGNINSHIVGGYDNLQGFPHTDDQGYHYGLGVCPFVRVGASVIFDANDSFLFPDYADLQSRAYRDGARVSNNSWGSNTADYDIDAQEYDALVRDAQPAGSASPSLGNQEMVIVFAAGNSGPFGQTVGSPATAKNVISVGASENVQSFGGPDRCGTSDSEADNADDIAPFSSRGPCSDGRHKPEIVAPGTHVSGGVAQAANWDTNGTADPCFIGSGVCGGITNSMFYPDGQQFFTSSTGTSHAAPGVAGGCALLRQYFANNFGALPSAAMTKAYLVNSARYLKGASANDDLWSDDQGMGEMNLGTAFDGVSRALRDQLPQDLFTASGQTRTYTGRVLDPSKPFRITLAWTDAPGNTTGNAYNNNLDLVVSIGGKTYKGNVFKGAYSAEGGAADRRNNVESVFLPEGTSGAFAISVRAVDINSDGVPNNGTSLDQDFALVIYNALMGTPPTVTGVQPANLTVLAGQPANFTVTATGDAPLSYQWLRNGTPLRNATNATLSFPAAQVSDTGTYSVVVGNRIDTATSQNVLLTVLWSVPLPFALNNTNLTWSTDLASAWFGQTNLSHDGQASGRSWIIGDAQQSTLRCSVQGPGTLTFWWKVSSQAGGDFLSFSGSALGMQAKVSGEIDWQQQQVYLPTGPQTVQWTYAKDNSVSSGRDAGFVDQVSYIAGITVPFISSQPANQGILAGVPVTFQVVANGTPPLQYQWRLNGTAIPGANSPVYALPSAQPTDNGTYSVVVTSPYGSVTSSDATLTVVPVVNSGNNNFAQGTPPVASVGAIAVAAGSWHSLALRDDGTVIAWGNNWNGQCDVPQNLRNVTAIAAGGYHSLAVKADGTVLGWGGNGNGQATPPAGLSNVVAVSAGAWHSLALLSDRTVVAWGDNSWNQLAVPPGLKNVKSIAAGGNHNLALTMDGAVIAWGQDTGPEGFYAGQSSVPWGLSNITAIGAGDYHSLAVKADGSIVLWGDNSQGQCQPPANLARVVQAAGGGSHSLALKADGTVAAWGNNWNGQCGIPSTLSNVVAIAAGNAHTLVLVGGKPAQLRLVHPVWAGKAFSVSVQTTVGKTYALEYQDSLTTTNWTALPPVAGDGLMQGLSDPNAAGPHRFYRVHQW